MGIDSDIASDLSEEEITFLNPICKFLGIDLPDPTKGILRIGPNELKNIVP